MLVWIIRALRDIDAVSRQYIYSATMQTLIDIREAKPLQGHQPKAELIDKSIRGL